VTAYLCRFEGDAVRRPGSKESRASQQGAKLMPGLFLEFGDQAGADAVKTGEESTPDVYGESVG